MPTVVIHAVDASGGDIVGARALRVEAGASVVEQRIVIREGERDRLLPLRFPADTGPLPRPVPADVWVLGGVGAAAALVSWRASF